MLQWLTDQAWVSWSYLSLNARKSLYRLGGARGRTPCQSASDSGRANETRCEACFVVKDARRFQAVCPVLRVDKGRVPICGVDAGEVRPYWGRALGYYGKIVLGLYLIAVCTGFIALRCLGYRVNPVSVGWPPRWHDLTLARADYFYEQGIAAYKDHDIKRSLLALTEGYELAPGRNEEGTLILAQLTQITWPSLSNGIYARLVQGRGPLAATAVEDWARALLARGDMPDLATLAASRLPLGDSQAPVWTHALVFACRQTGDWSLARASAGASGVPRDCRSVLRVALDCLGKPLAGQEILLVSALDQATSSFARFEFLERLIELNRATTAISWAQGHLDLVASRERACVILDAAASGGWDDLRVREFDRLLAEPKSSMLVNLLAGHLIRYPDPTLTEALFRRLDAEPLAANAENYSAYNALLCLAGVDRSEVRIDAQIGKLRAISGTPSASLNVVKDYFLNRAKTMPIAQYLPAVQPLSLEVSYALLRRFQGGPPPPDGRQGQARSN